MQFELIDELLLKAHSLKHTLSANGVIKLQKSQQEGTEPLSLEAAASPSDCKPAWQFSRTVTSGQSLLRGQKNPRPDSWEHVDKGIRHLRGASSISGHDDSIFQDQTV